MICFIKVKFVEIILQLDPNDAAAVKEMLRKAALQGLVVPEKKKSIVDTESKQPTIPETPPIK